MKYAFLLLALFGGILILASFQQYKWENNQIHWSWGFNDPVLLIVGIVAAIFGIYKFFFQKR